MTRSSYFLALLCLTALAFAYSRALCSPPPLLPSSSSTSPSAALTQDASVETILDDLHDRGVGLKDFTADLTITHDDQGLGDMEVKTGHVWYQSLKDGGARLRVLLDSRSVGDSKTIGKKVDHNFKREYLLDNGVLTDRNFNVKPQVQIKRVVLKPGQKLNLLKLGEGPFPLPIGQDKADVHKIFAVAKVAPGKDDPGNTVHLVLTPNKGTSFARKFHQLDVWVNLTSGMPSRIATVSPDQAATETTDLKNLKVNTGVPDSDLTLPPIDKTWDMQDESYRD